MLFAALFMGYIKSLEQQMLFVSQGFLPSCLNFGYKEMFSLVDVLQIAVVIYWVGFLLVLIFMQKFRYLCLTKSIVLPFSVLSSGNNWTQNKLIAMAFSVVPFIFQAIAFALLMLFSWTSQTSTKFGQNASWLSRICLGIWANQKLRIATVLFLKNINKTNALFSVTSLSR